MTRIGVKIIQVYESTSCIYMFMGRGAISN